MTVLYVLYASSFLISVRCIYRVVEFFEGVTGPIYRTEAYFHVSRILYTPTWASLIRYRSSKRLSCT